MARREKGSATLACPHCGTELAAEREPDGSLAASTCKCTKKRVEAETAAAEESGPTRETGTDTTEE